MFESSRLPLLIVVVGPTGAGKSDLALALARKCHGEIVNCDSVQVYQGLDIGSAKTAPAARLGIPHHLLDIARPDQEVTAADFQRLGRTALGEITSRGRCPVVVGGTGFYLRALLDGLSDAPPRHQALRLRLSRIARSRPTTLHRILSRHDADAASRIHANDHQKLIRALELIALTGQPASVIQARPRNPLTGYRVIRLGLNPPRDALYHVLDRRTEHMFSNGLLVETQRLLDAGFRPNLKPLQSLGYKQALDILSGRASLQMAITECQTKTRQYAKRQLTWFRADSGIIWLAGFGFDLTIQAAAAARVAEADQ